MYLFVGVGQGSIISQQSNFSSEFEFALLAASKSFRCAAEENVVNLSCFCRKLPDFSLRG
jgi:hypothetical protein